MSALARARAAQRAYAADPTPAHRAEAQAAQRAYDAEREAARREAIAAERREASAALIARVERRLAQPIPDKLNAAPVGLVSHRRAQNLMMAPAVAGGAIWVDLSVPSDLRPYGTAYHDILLALGSVAIDPDDGWGWCVALDRRKVIAALRSQARLLAHINIDLEGDVDDILTVIDRLEMQSEQGVEVQP